MHILSIIRIIGILIMCFSGTMLIPAFVALIYGDGGGKAFMQAFALSLTVGMLLWWPCHHHKQELRSRDGFLIVVAFWFVLGGLATLPLLLFDSPHLTVASAVFEAFSGLTTTGATVMTGLDNLPKAILFYRQFLQWLGGMGIIVLAIAIIPLLGIGGMQLYRAEMSGPMKDQKIQPRIAETAKALWFVYFFLTMSCTLAYWLAGMTPFDALTHSFSTVSIGGFSTHDASIGYFNSSAINFITVIFYSSSIFAKAGLGEAASILGSVGIGTINVLVTIVAIFVVDKIDRKKLLVGGNIGMIASLLIMAILIWTIGIASSAWIIIVCLSLFIVFFGISWGPVLWVMLPELFPMRARGAATGISALVLNIGTLIVSLFFPILSDALSTEWVFLIFAFIGVLAMIFVIKFLPETRGRSLEEIEYELRERTGARTE